MGGTLQAECGAGAKALRPARAGPICRSRQAFWLGGIQRDGLPGVVETQHGQTVAKLCGNYGGESQPKRKWVCGVGVGMGVGMEVAGIPRAFSLDSGPG